MAVGTPLAPALDKTGSTPAERDSEAQPVEGSPPLAVHARILRWGILAEKQFHVPKANRSTTAAASYPFAAECGTANRSVQYANGRDHNLRLEYQSRGVDRPQPERVFLTFARMHAARRRGGARPRRAQGLDLVL
ncbi:hypothetical protein GCM10010121_084060 [Streptomyces brasiliensis]|uniref:Uncharacterized protein n=1 Tax=Streptomyces brasiliensis TaxID=1954 RepID=A0A917P419_9ACTN|nr:hypothetical protein GCM10010121_084060 [Streptomyces brasiliensis]